MIPGSGNHLVDAEDAAQDKPTRLECGCRKICTCDDEDEDIEEDED